MFLINFQLWARNGKIPGGGNFNIRGGFNISGKRLLRPLGCTAGVASSRLPRSEPSRLRSLSFLPPLSSVLLVTHPLCTSCWLTHAGCRHPSTAASQPAQRRLPCTGTLTFAVVKKKIPRYVYVRTELKSGGFFSHTFCEQYTAVPVHLRATAT